MTDHGFRHPVMVLWQRCLNALEVPSAREQRDVLHGVLVHRLARDVRGQTYGEWL